MKNYMLKTFLLTCVMLSGITVMQAQFDDVYYDPDNLDPEIDYRLEPASAKEYTYEEEVTYYDDDEYEYYDDYDYYYTSRVNRFHRSYSGFDFYDPIYVNYNYYDPFHGDSYYYPGSSIYISFGNNSYWDYRHWRNYNRWNRWNNYSQWNNWCVTPSSYYYSYNNNWYGSGYNYWGGNHGYHSYSNYYNNYYNSCPYPVSYYNGITNTTIHNVNSGGTRGTYYGPRITGNTGSSPRGPVTNPGAVQPVYKDRDNNFTDTNDRPVGLPEGVPGRVTPIDPNNNPVPVDRQNNDANDNSGGVRQVPVDKEVNRDQPITPKQRPIFRPDSEKYQPYPNDRTKTTPDKPVYTPEKRPSTTPRENYTPRPTEQRPSYTPPRESEKPSYTPPPRNNNDRPSYTPPPSNNNDRPAYTPPRREESPKSNDRPSYTPPPKRDERPSYSPPPRNDSPRSSDRSSYSPSPSRDNNSSSSGSRSSGGSGGSNNSSSSPRGRG